MAMNYGEVETRRRKKIMLSRRRLSAPETIMRKHVLAQQRSSSQDSTKSSDSDSSSSWHTTRGSDSNLAKRRSTDIRKSTLMKRFWESSKGNVNLGSFPSSFAEWQHGAYRAKGGSTKSLLTESPKARFSPHNFQQPPFQHHQPQHQQQQSPSDGSFVTNQPRTEEDSYVVYSSTENTARTDATDSYPITSPSESVNNNSSSPGNPGANASNVLPATKAYRINNQGISDVTNEADIPNLPIKYQFVINENQNQYEFVPQPQQPSRTESPRTNLNVITNVQLSQSTLNMIFSQVMQDVLQKPLATSEVIDDKITKQKAYNFKLNIDEPSDCSQKADDNVEVDVDPEEKLEINVGSPYRNRASPSVPRLSAMPRTSSMEVNISSNDSLDRDSDNSLVDSLDDPSSPRLKIKYQKNTKETKTKETMSTLHDQDVLEDGDEVIEKKETKKTIKKSSVFYIPIDNIPLKSESDSPQTVSDLLPSKLKEKLLRRQLKREEKRLQERLKAFDFENGNATAYFSTSPETTIPPPKKTTKNTKPTSQRSQKMKKTTLPQIDLTKDYNKSLRSNYTHRSLNKYRESVQSETSNKKSFMLPKAHTKQYSASSGSSPKQSKEKLKSPLSTTKHIEILEIMEIVEPERTKTKSRIPVFQHQSGTKLPKLRSKPLFLDFGEVGQPGDPKLDQLIANILIDTLNHEDIKDATRIKAMTPTPTSTATSAKDKDKDQENNIQIPATSKVDSIHSPSLVEQAAEILTKQVLDNHNLDHRDGARIVENVDAVDPKDLEGNDVPKGWITFYMLQKAHLQSPDSTSDEGEHTAKTATATRSTQYARGDVRNQRSSPSESDSETSHKKSRMRPKLRHYVNKKDGWSVTFSNNSELAPAPEVEMKFKFPTLNPLDSTQKSKGSGLSFEDVAGKVSQSEIYKSKQYLKNPKNVKIKRRRITLSPRATKTSRQRTMLNRQSHVHGPEDESFQDESLATPTGLAISGSTLNSIRRLPIVSTQVLKQLLAKLQGHSQTTKESNKLTQK